MFNKNLNNFDDKIREELSILQKKAIKDHSLQEEFRIKVYDALTAANLKTKLHEYGFHSVLTPLEKGKITMYK